MYTVYVPPWDVLRDMFPDSDTRAIVNGETIKGKPAHGSQQYWWPSSEELIADNRLVTFHPGGSHQHMGIGTTGQLTYRVFVEWLVKLDWKPYGEQKILKRTKGSHVHSHNPGL